MEERQYINVAKLRGRICVRELVNGKEEKREVWYKPVLFQKSNKITEYKNFYQDLYLEKKDFQTFHDMKEYIENIGEISEEIWGCTDIELQFISSQNYNSTDTSKLNISYLDIEVCTRLKRKDGSFFDGGFPDAFKAEYPINAICDYRSSDKKYHVFTTAPNWSVEKSKLRYAKDVDYHYCRTEEELIKKWLCFWSNKYPHVVTGWNTTSFDIPYIVNRISNLFGDDKVKILSPWKEVDTKKGKDKYGEDFFTFSIKGISHLDYISLYKKYRYKPREKYTLQFISSIECPLDHKLEFEGTHGELYWNDPVFFVDYNIQDVHCILNLENQLQFIKLACYISYYAKVNFESSFSPIKVWESIIYNSCLEKNIIIPYRSSLPKKENFEGAYVHNPTPGMVGCVASFDYTSLYPSIILQHYMGADVYKSDRFNQRSQLKNELKEILMNDTNPKSQEMLDEILQEGKFNKFYIHNDMPECVIKFLQEKKVSISTNCEFFDIEKESVIVGLVNKLFIERKSDKKTSFMYKHKAQYIKVELEKRGVKI